MLIDIKTAKYDNVQAFHLPESTDTKVEAMRVGNKVTDFAKTLLFSKVNKEKAYRFDTENDTGYTNWRMSFITDYFEGKCELVEVIDQMRNIGRDVLAIPFKDAYVDDELVNGISFLVFSQDSEYLTTELEAGDELDFLIHSSKGFGINDVEFAFVVFDTYKQDGYRVICSDYGRDTKYHFNYLGLYQLDMASFHTKQYMVISRQFIDKQDIDRHEKEIMALELREYLTTVETINFEEIATKVFKDNEGIAESYETYVTAQALDKGLPEPAKVALNYATVKTKITKPIKLNTGITISMQHAECADHIEAGFDEDKDMNYYKVYFQRES